MNQLYEKSYSIVINGYSLSPCLLLLDTEDLPWSPVWGPCPRRWLQAPLRFSLFCSNGP